jgi:ATP-dependent Clp protease protease subunit
MIPTIFEKSSAGIMSYDILSKLLKERIMFIGSEDITTDAANLIIAQLLYLESEANDKAISIYLNCPGGSVLAGLAIYDTMMHVNCPIYTTVIGHAMSFGLVLLAAGSPGKRYALPHARMMMHQPLIMGRGLSGQATDIEIEAKEMAYHKRTLAEILSLHTGKSVEKILADGERNAYFSAKEAKEYGFIDHVVESHKRTLLSSWVGEQK